MKKWKEWASGENMLKYMLAGTLLVFAIFYHKASRYKQRTLSGQLLVTVKHLESGNDFITGEEMKQSISKKFSAELANKPIGHLSPIDIEAGLKSLDFIKSADVYIDAMSRLNVYVTQREPVLRLINHYGYSMYVDKDGTTMPASLHYSPRVLVAYADVPNRIDTLKLNVPGIQKDIFTLAGLIRSDRVMNTLLEQISIDQNLEWTLVPKIGPSKIYIGNLDDIDEKFDTIKKIYKEILPAEGWDKYGSVNIKFKGQVICTKKA